jgi:hypothetical protein
MTYRAFSTSREITSKPEALFRGELSSVSSQQRGTTSGTPASPGAGRAG